MVEKGKGIEVVITVNQSRLNAKWGEAMLPNQFLSKLVVLWSLGVGGCCDKLLWAGGSEKQGIWAGKPEKQSKDCWRKQWHGKMVKSRRKRLADERKGLQVWNLDR